MNVHRGGAEPKSGRLFPSHTFLVWDVVRYHTCKSDAADLSLRAGSFFGIDHKILAHHTPTRDQGVNLLTPFSCDDILLVQGPQINNDHVVRWVTWQEDSVENRARWKTGPTADQAR
eukprot:1159942-Pelagomonas_calceolata.AAC.6